MSKRHIIYFLSFLVVTGFEVKNQYNLANEFGTNIMFAQEGKGFSLFCDCMTCIIYEN